ncbi:hypothetical protein HQ531_08030 [bacterium]|nr:hypothetical protein [bacterium]
MTDEEKQPEQEEQEEVKSDRTSKLMNDMIKGMREFGSAALEKAEEFGKLATDKAEELSKLGKIKLDIHQLKRSRTKDFAELGELVFNLGLKKKLAKINENEDYKALVSSIKQLNNDIKAKETEELNIDAEQSGEKV